MASSPSLLILGAAGYIGGTVMTSLLTQHEPSSISVLVRKPEQRDHFEKIGVNIIPGDVSDASKMGALATNYDVVFNFAAAFGGDEVSIHALVDGLEERAKKTKTKPVYVYTGGSGTIMYGSEGEAGIDVEDLAQLTVAVANCALENPGKTTASAESKGFETLIYSGVATHQWKSVIETLGDLSYARGEVKSPSAKQIGEGQGILYMFGCNSFLERSKKVEVFSFEPKQEDLISSMKKALPASRSRFKHNGRNL